MKLSSSDRSGKSVAEILGVDEYHEGMIMSMTPEKMRRAVESRLARLFVVDGFDDPIKRRIFLGDMPDMEKYLKAKDEIAIKRSQGNFPACLMPCYKEPLLTAAQEYHQARKYNLLKLLAKERLSEGQVRYAHCFMQRAIEVGNQIAESNFRLAASIIRQKVGLKDEEKLSDAYMDVMKAVDYFDYTRGLKFSTYTTWIIHRTLIRTWQSQQRERERGFFFVDTDTMGENFVSSSHGHEQEQQYQIDKQTVAYLLDHCGLASGDENDLQRRQYILTHRFGLGQARSMTLEEIGKELGISKERVRQLESSSIKNILRFLQEKREQRRKVA